MIEFTPTVITILLGLLHVIIYVFICWRKKKECRLFHVVMNFLNGFIPYGTYEAFYSGFTNKTIPSDQNQVILIVAGLSLAWIYYHLLTKLMQGES